MRKLALIATATALAGAVSIAVPATADTVINFETTSDGTPTVSGNAVGTDYAADGITFTDAFYHQCGGGCPDPDYGHFISTDSYTGPFSAVFNGTTDSFSFANVSNSFGSASAYNSGGTLLETIAFGAFPATYSFSSTGIHSVIFSGGPYGVDDFTFGALSGGVPEPATWAMMIIGFGAVGGVMRRRSTTVSYA